MEEITASPRLQQFDDAKAALDACQHSAEKANTNLQQAKKALRIVEIEQQKAAARISTLQEKEASAKAEYLPKVGGVESVLETTFNTVRLTFL